MPQTFNVELGERAYPIHFGTGLADLVAEQIGELAGSGRPVAVVTDANLRRHQSDFIDALGRKLPVIVLDPGEQTKSLECLGQVYDFLAESRIDRTGCVFAVGGGVIGDLAGFAAASYLRGIDFYQVPTTLLAMVDSSVGGKTGINIAAGKNLVGAFHQPRAVYIDTDLLKTLPAREFSAGMAEVIKTGMLADAQLFSDIFDAGRLIPAHPKLPGIIRRCCEIKAAVVIDDEKEQAASGGRALLNLGHTFAHAIEAVTGYNQYLHGEAVAIGLILASRLSQRLRHIDGIDVEAVSTLVSTYGLPVALRRPLPVSQLLEAMKRDKKVKQGRLRFVAMKSIGKAITVEDVSEDLIHELWLEAGATEG